jgi:hypothetical protein
MDDLGQASSLLGMKISHSPGRLTLSQHSYTEKLLQTYNHQEVRVASTPMVPNTRLDPATDTDREAFLAMNEDYRQAIGSLNYLAVNSRPDIAFAVSQLSQHLERPGKSHWQAFLHLLRYLAGTRTYSITIGGSPTIPQIFTDADYANCAESRRSYSAYVVTWGDSILSWKSRKQPTVSSSTTEAEYRALYDGTQEAVWLNYLLNSLRVTLKAPIAMLVDNQAAIALAKNPMHQQRTKHIDVKFHWTREIIEAGKVTISYIQTSKMLADGLTKSLAKPKHQEFIRGLKIGS